MGLPPHTPVELRKHAVGLIPFRFKQVCHVEIRLSVFSLVIEKEIAAIFRFVDRARSNAAHAHWKNLGTARLETIR